MTKNIFLIVIPFTLDPLGLGLGSGPLAVADPGAPMSLAVEYLQKALRCFN